jgi:hypothetical protein
VHPNKFLGRVRQQAKPAMSESEKAERLESLSEVIAGRRKDSVDARKTSGIEDVWLKCEEAYLGIDDANRHEFSQAKWAKPTSINGPVTSNKTPKDDTKSTAFVLLTSRYVDFASAKLGEILLPIDDKAFAFSPTPDPDLVAQKEDLSPLIDKITGQPVMRPMTDAEMQQQAQPDNQSATMPPMTPVAQGAQQMVAKTIADQAQELMDKAKDAAEKAESRIYDWMTESKYPAEVRKVIADSARIGVGVLKGPFPEVKKSQAVTKSKKGIVLEIKEEVVPTYRWVDPWNIFPDESCGENIHNGDGIFERDFLSKSMLSKLKKEPYYLPNQIDKVLEEGPGKAQAEGRNPHEKKTKNRFEIWHYYGILSRKDFEASVGDDELMGELKEDQEDVFAIVSMVNDTIIKVILNPLESGRFPYHTMSWSRRPGHWAGVGIGEKIDMPQRMVNASTRAVLNNAGISSGVQIVLDAASLQPADKNWHITPNKIWLLSEEGVGKDVRSVFNSIEIPNVVAELMPIIQYGMKLAEESTGIALVTQGQDGDTTPQTFGQAELQNNNASTWLRNVGYRFDDQITEPVVTESYEWLLLDPEVPDDEKGDFQINAHGSIAMVERAIQEQTLLGLFNAATNPAYKINPSKLFEEFLKAKRLDPRKIQYSEQEQQQMQQQPPAPPIQVMVEQVKGQNALALEDKKTQGELAQIAAEAQQTQQQLQTGGMTPHMATATAQIERERIRAATAERVEESRAHAEAARADKEYLIAQQNGQFRLEEKRLDRELKILEYSAKHNLTLEQVKAELAKTSIQEETKRQLAAAEIELAQAEGDKDRAVDVHKHTTSLVRDQITTPNTP